MPDTFANQDFNFRHMPVLTDELLDSINKFPKELLNDGLIIDATLGGGGHCEILLKEHKNLRAIGLDQDPYARTAAQKRLANFGQRIKILDTNFADFTPPEKALLVLADLGVSSPQLDIAARGFSFRLDGPLDMRMNPTQKLTAADLIENLEENALADLIFTNGEEKFARRIAHKIKNDLSDRGQYQGTIDLAYSIAGCYPRRLRYGRIHPATRTFQALRIAVNDELTVLSRFLKACPDWIIPGGLITIISFHSLEDRLVKSSFLQDERLERVTKKPLVASPSEVSINPRSRSAKCRIARRTILNK